MSFYSSGRNISSYNRHYCRRKRCNATVIFAIRLVLEEVHPSYLGLLPPCPRLLASKAHSKGLITFDEYFYSDYYFCK